MHPNLFPYICTQVYPLTDVILEDILLKYNYTAGSVSFLYHIKLCDVMNMCATSLTVCLQFFHIVVESFSFEVFKTQYQIYDKYSVVSMYLGYKKDIALMR